MIQNLNNNLITAPELAELRKRLRNLETKDGQVFFVALFRSWCHNAVATFSLCLLAQAYEQAYNLLQIFAELEMTVNMLIQIDKLVQLLESPVFTCKPSIYLYLDMDASYLVSSDLRLQLLEPERYPHLYKCLYGVLMLLPQSSAFAALKNRLNSVSAIGYLHIAPRTTYVSSHVRQKSTETKFTSGPPSTASTASFDRPNRLKPREEGAIRWNELLEKFKAVQEKAKRASRPQGALEDTPALIAGPESAGMELGSQKALPEVPKQPAGGNVARPTSAESGNRVGAVPVPASPAPPPHKTKSSLGHLGRFAGNVAGRKGKK